MFSLRSALATLVAAAAVASLAGCVPTGTRTRVNPPSSVNSTDAVPDGDLSSAAAASSPTKASTSNLPAGASVTVETNYPDASGTIAVLAFIPNAKSSNQFDSPKNGQYLVTDVQATGVSGSFDYNPYDFKVQTADGRLWDPSYGSFDPQLNSGTLGTGQSARGNIVFDVPDTTGATLIYSASYGEQSASWVVG